MTPEELKNMTAAYDELIDRAIFISRCEPFRMYCDMPEHARITIDGDVAILSWPEWASGYYAGEGNIEAQSIKFAASLLLLSADDLKNWKTEQQDKKLVTAMIPPTPNEVTLTYEEYQNAMAAKTEAV